MAADAGTIPWIIFRTGEGGMNWTKASAIAEIVSSIAIVITLFYLGAQSRQLSEQTEQNTSAVISGIRQQSLDTEVAMLLKMMDNADDAPGGRTAADTRTELVYSIALRIRETQWLQLQDGLLDQATWDTYKKILMLTLSRDDQMRAWWERSINLGVFTPGFVRTVNEGLRSFEVTSNPAEDE
jgi:hypothetical protein